MVRIEFETDNAAFEDHGFYEESRRIIESALYHIKTAGNVESHMGRYPLTDRARVSAGSWHVAAVAHRADRVAEASCRAGHHAARFGSASYL